MGNSQIELPTCKQAQESSLMITQVPTLTIYRQHLEATADWLMRSIAHGKGGSCAYFSVFGGWSRPYPETTGYLIPTLLELKQWLPALDTEQAALSVGNWLLKIQHPDGYWCGGLYPPIGEGYPAVFNTGQIIKGMIALYQHTGESKWLKAAKQGASWLAAGVDTEGWWSDGHYREHFTPCYYAQVAWPMLEVWQHNQDQAIKQAAERHLKAILERRCENGTFRGWGFEEDQPAFTHTIAYTLRGLLESAQILEDWHTYGEPTVQALEKLVRRTELTGGYLPGSFDENWKSVGRYTCLTGNAQIALCLLTWEQRIGDLRLVNAAAKLVDCVCATQSVHHLLPGLRGSVAGSSPVWGRYMMLRYPNWAAKYHCDALIKLIIRIQKELV